MEPTVGIGRLPGDTLVSTIEARHGIDLHARGDMHLETLLKRRGFDSLNQLLKAHRGELYHHPRPRHVFLSFHAANLRQVSGFDLNQLGAEYRALRASVIRLWMRSRPPEIDSDMVEDMIRFNEAVDQAVAESTSRYAAELALSRDTFMAILAHDLRSPLSAIRMNRGRTDHVTSRTVLWSGLGCGCSFAALDFALYLTTK